MSLGVSFAPTTDAANQPSSGVTSPSFGNASALKTLSFRLPSVTGAAGGGNAGSAGLSPQVGQDQRGSFASAVLESVLRTVLGPDHADQVIQSASGTGSDSGAAMIQQMAGSVPGTAPGVTIHPGDVQEPGIPRGTGAIVDPPTTPTPNFADRRPSQDPGTDRATTGYSDFFNNEALLNDRTGGAAVPTFGDGGGGATWRTQQYPG